MSRSVGSQMIPASAVSPWSKRAPRAFAALEVVGDAEHDDLAALRFAERGEHRRGHHHRRGAALHVGRAGTVDLSVADRRAPRVEAPRLRRRIDVVVAAEEEAAGRSRHRRRGRVRWAPPACPNPGARRGRPPRSSLQQAGRRTWRARARRPTATSTALPSAGSRPSRRHGRRHSPRCASRPHPPSVTPRARL